MEEPDALVAPLTQTLGKLSTSQDHDSVFAIPTGSTKKGRSRSRSLSMQFTPGIRKPVPEFHSTGLLSKKNHSRQQPLVTPETPVKQKTLLEGVWKAPVSDTPLRQLQPFSVLNSPYGGTPLKSKPSLTPHPQQPSFQSPSSSKVNRLHRSPLKESPTKINKRPHLLSSSPGISRFGGSDMLEPESPTSETFFNPLNTTPIKSGSRRESEFDSPPVMPKTFFSKLVKDRPKVSPSTTIPFSTLISRQRIVITPKFFDALDGLIRLDFSSSHEQIHQDYFEQKFEMIGRLGNGEFADAFHVKSREDGWDYAIKKTRQSFTGYKDARYKLQEVKMLLRIGKHPSCVSLKEAWIQFGYIYIQMELCNRGTLSSFMDENCSSGPIDEEEIWKIMGDIILGLRHIHSQGIVHLDLKPANIFISESRKLKIGDFGLAALPPIDNDEHEGDRTYLAPEILSAKTVSYPADIFSLGLIVLELIANIILPENGPIWHQLREGDLREIPFLDRSPMLIDFVKSMIHPEPSMRPTASDLMRHPRLASFELEL